MATIEKIGGRTYSFGPMPASKALRVEVAIARVIGEPLFKALTGNDPSIGNKKEQMKQMGMAAVGMMTSRMDADELLVTMQAVFDHISVDGQPIVNIDAAFTGRNKELWQVFIKGLQVNFADFFDGLASLLPPDAMSMLKPSSPQTSTGTSSGR
jgi:hypothetical protein